MSDVQTTLRLNDQASQVLQRVANAARQTASQMQQTGRAIDQAFKSSAPGTFASRVDTAFRNVSSSAEALGNAVDEVFGDADMGSFFDDAEEGLRRTGDAARDIRDGMEDLGRAAEDLGGSLDGIDGNGLGDLGNDAGAAGQELGNATEQALGLSNALAAVAAAAAAALISGKVKQFVEDSVSLGMSYSSVMSEVAAISGATGAEYEMLESTARQYGATTVFSASEAAEALKYMSLAGWDANQSASALGGVLNLAASAGMGLGEASDMVTDYLSAFGMEADQAGYFADMLAYAQSHSNTSAAQLGQAFLNSAANLHSAGQDIETTTSLLEAMANQGTKGSQAGTQLAAIMRDITNQMEDGEIQIGKTSVAVQDQYGNFRDLTDILSDVEKAVDGMGSAERAAALSTTFTADSTKGINQILTEGMSNISQYEEELRHSAGAAADAAHTMNDNLQGDLASMNSAYEEMQLQVFESLEGSLRAGVQYVTGTVIPALTEWVPAAIGTVADGIKKLASALEPMFSVLLKNPKAVATGLTAIGTAIAVWKGAGVVSAITNAGGFAGVIGKLGAAITAHPWALGAAAIAAAVVAIKGAVDMYNDVQMKNSLESHFGDVELSESDASSLAGKIISVDWGVNVNLALNAFENAEEFHREAEEALQANKALLWKASVQTILEEAVDMEGSGAQAEAYAAKVQGWITSYQESHNLTYTPKVQTVMTGLAGADELLAALTEPAEDAVGQARSQTWEEIAWTIAERLTPEDGDAAEMAAYLIEAPENARAIAQTWTPEQIEWLIGYIVKADGKTPEEISEGLTANAKSAGIKASQWNPDIIEWLIGYIAKADGKTPEEIEEDLTQAASVGRDNAQGLTFDNLDWAIGAAVTYTGESAGVIEAKLVANAKAGVEAANGTSLPGYTPSIGISVGITPDSAVLTSRLVGLLKAVKDGATSERIGELAADITTSLGITEEESTRAQTALVGLVNGIVSGAEGEELEPYADSLTVDLTPEMAGTFLSSLGTAVADATAAGTLSDEQRTYKDKLYINLTPEMQGEFKDNIDAFIAAKKSELEQLTFASATSIETFLGEKAGSAMIEQVKTWAAQDTGSLEQLSGSLTRLVEDALEDGVLDVNEQAAIDILQAKINNILTGWKRNQAEAEWQVIEQSWSGRNLTSDSFVTLLGQMQSQRESAMDAARQDALEMNAVFNGWVDSKKITGIRRDELSGLMKLDLLNKEADALTRGMTYAGNTLTDTYGELIETNLQRIKETAGDGTDYLLSTFDDFFAGGTDITNISDLLNNQNLAISRNGGGDRLALLELYEAMKPDVSGMAGLIDAYRNMGAEVPQTLIDAYNQAIDIGAAAGDVDAGWQKMANAMVNSGNEQLVAALSDPSNDMYETLRSQMPPALEEAVDRALYASEKAVEDTDMSGLWSSILSGLSKTEPELDLTATNELLEKYGVSISEYIAAMGVEADGSHVKIALKDFDPADAAQYANLKATGNAITLESGQIALEYEVITGDTLSNIAEATGVTLDALEAANQHILEENGSWDLIYPGNIIYVPEVSTDTAGLAAEAGAAAQEAAETVKEAAGEAGSVQQDVTMTAGAVNTSEVGEAVQKAADNEFASPIETEGMTNVELDENDNVPEIYDTVGQKVDSAFSAGYSTSASVNVNLTASYSLSNPSETISFSDGSSTTITASLSGHALGGYFDRAHIALVAEDGPEYIIPMDGSDRSRSMWEEAGAMLGLLDRPIGTMPPVETGASRSQSGAGTGGSRDINLNINGSGRMTVSSNMSKEDIVDVMAENIKAVLMDIIQQEILTEGDMAYGY